MENWKGMRKDRGPAPRLLNFITHALGRFSQPRSFPAPLDAAVLGRASLRPKPRMSTPQNRAEKSDAVGRAFRRSWSRIQSGPEQRRRLSGWAPGGVSD